MRLYNIVFSTRKRDCLLLKKHNKPNDFGASLSNFLSDFMDLNEVQARFTVWKKEFWRSGASYLTAVFYLQLLSRPLYLPGAGRKLIQFNASNFCVTSNGYIFLVLHILWFNLSMAECRYIPLYTSKATAWDLHIEANSLAWWFVGSSYWYP